MEAKPSPAILPTVTADWASRQSAPGLRLAYPETPVLRVLLMTSELVISHFPIWIIAVAAHQNGTTLGVDDGIAQVTVNVPADVVSLRYSRDSVRRSGAQRRRGSRF